MVLDRKPGRAKLPRRKDASTGRRTCRPTDTQARGKPDTGGMPGALAAPAVVALMLLLGAGNPTRAADAETAIFAGGCFWCVEADFDKIPGVIETVSGYTGGHTQNPTYKQVTGGDTGHYEAVRIRFDPDKVGYAELVSALLRSVDPTDDGGQFCDRGASYRTAIFTQGAGPDADCRGAEGGGRKAARHKDRDPCPGGRRVLSRGGLPPGLP